MRGRCVVVSADAKGRHEEGFVKASQTFYPGMVVIRDPSVALVGGRHTYKIYDETADGDQPTGAFWVVTERLMGMIGLAITDAVTMGSYAAGEKCSLYSPLPGDDLNLLIKNLTGTADDHTAGEKLMVDTGTGKLIATTGTPETEIAQLLETITDPVADTLGWCQWSGI